MSTTAAHYDAHLGPIYSWMLGDAEAALARSAAELDQMQLPSAPGAVAVDLGAGLGLHALPLAQRGFRVIAIDRCQVLLDELLARRAALPITAINADLLEFRSFVEDGADVIVCMGDTLTHLATSAAVESLLAAVAASLAPAGVFAATFRDYASRTLEGADRFILVRADPDRILTCFLEYADESVMVHDVLNQRENGRWRQAVSSYPKLRLSPGWVAAQLTGHGLDVRTDAGSGGMVRIVATKS